jgi:hypothetical protein
VVATCKYMMTLRLRTSRQANFAFLDHDPTCQVIDMLSMIARPAVAMVIAMIVGLV